MAGVN